MTLEFAETQNADPVHISRVRPDQINAFYCPHCRQRVIATTRLTEHWVQVPHFAHVRQTCQYVEAYEQEEHIRIPLYREFERYSDPDIVAGSLPLFELYKLQQDAMRYVYSVFYDEHRKAPAMSDPLSYRQTDRKLFEWTHEKCLLFTLYYVEIELTGETICHIGSSDQPPEAYLKRLTKEFPPADVIRDIRVRFALPQMASLEYYFQHRFRTNCYIFRNYQALPDFFQFSSEKLEQVLEELRHLPYVTNTRRENILMGIVNARMAGKRIGRPPESPERFLRKKKSQQIAKLLRQGLSAREIRKRTGSAPKTIKKVERLLRQQSEAIPPKE
jgi:DNA-binding NarL/FixJ family response regulator